MQSGATVEAPLRERAQVVVVGTGPGGASVAAKAAQAGLDVVMLEAGPHVPASKMTQREGEMMRLLYWEAGTRTTENGAMSLLHGRAVGGSSVVNFLDCFRTPARILDLWRKGHGLPDLEPAAMAERFARIDEILHVRKLDAAQLNPNNDKLRIACERLGWKGDTFHRNADNCVGSGFCDLGCAYNAKQSAALTFVPIATGKGARLYTDCHVERVEFAGGRATGVRGQLLGADRTPRGEFTVEADCVVVSGGAIQTPYLLLASGMADPSAQLGRNFWTHPGTPVVGHFPGERIANYEGIKQAYYISEWSWVLNDHPIDALLEGIGAPPGITSMVVAGLGAQRRADMATYNEYAASGVLLRDTEPGRVRAGEGRPIVDWELGPADGWRMRQAIEKNVEAFLAAGATTAYTGHAKRMAFRSLADLRKLDSAGLGAGEIALFNFHQMGTARMGGSRDRSVVDPTGKAWEYKNLYVADASLFPSATGVNPQITVYGLADIVADAVAGRAWARG